MSRLLDALGVTAGRFILGLLIIVIGGLNIFGPAFAGILMFVTAVTALFFGQWLTERGQLLVSPPHLEYAAYCKRVAYALFAVVFIRFMVLANVPATVALVKSGAARLERHNQRAALEQDAVHEVPCNGALYVEGATKYYYLPGEDPLRCYDRAGEHPDGKGPTRPVDANTAQTIRAQQQRAAASHPPTEDEIRQLVVAELAKTQPPPVAPQSADGEWVAVPNHRAPQ
jgi:hypothetical protein